MQKILLRITRMLQFELKFQSKFSILMFAYSLFKMDNVGYVTDLRQRSHTVMRQVRCEDICAGLSASKRYSMS